MFRSNDLSWKRSHGAADLAIFLRKEARCGLLLQEGRGFSQQMQMFWENIEICSGRLWKGLDTAGINDLGTADLNRDPPHS